MKFSIRKLVATYTNIKPNSRGESNNISKENGNDKKRQNHLGNLQNISEIGTEIGKDTQVDPNPASVFCSFCQCEVKANGLQANWKWNLEPNTLLCSECYTKKANEYERRINYCNSCQKKLGFIRYNPKPIWKLSGQMCRRCWDSKNVFEQKRAERKK